MKRNNELPEIVKRALVETVTSIGQLTEQETRTLNTYVKRGWLSKGLGGPFPRLKTVYAHPGYDFAAWRERYVNHAIALACLDEAAQQRRNEEYASYHTARSQTALTLRTEDGDGWLTWRRQRTLLTW